MWPGMLCLRSIIHRRLFRLWPHMLIHKFRIFRILRRMLHHSNIAFRKRIYVENAQHVSCATKCANMQLTYVCTKGKMRNRICGEIAQNAKQGKMRNMRRKTISLVSMCYVVVYMYIYIKKQILYILRTYATPEYIYMCICIYIYIHTLSGHLEWRPCVATLTGENIRHCPSSLFRDPRGMF